MIDALLTEDYPRTSISLSTPSIGAPSTGPYSNFTQLNFVHRHANREAEKYEPYRSNIDNDSKSNSVKSYNLPACEIIIVKLSEVPASLTCQHPPPFFPKPLHR